MENQNKNQNQTKNIDIETFAGDMAQAIEGAEGGFIKRIIHEQENNEYKKENLSIKSKKNKIFILVGTGLIFLAVIVLVVFFLNKNRIITLDVGPQYTPLVFSDNNSFVPIDDLGREEIMQTLSGMAGASLVKKDGIELFYLTVNNKVIGLREFLRLTKSYLNIEENTLVSDNFLLGVANKESKDFFILLKVRSAPDIFSAMRAWENKFFSDLHNFWKIEITPDNAYLLTQDFQDGIMQNKNARILYDKEGKIVLAYIFVADDSVLITNTEQATAELILRLSSSKMKR